MGPLITHKALHTPSGSSEDQSEAGDIRGRVEDQTEAEDIRSRVEDQSEAEDISAAPQRTNQRQNS